MIGNLFCKNTKTFNKIFLPKNHSKKRKKIKYSWPHPLIVDFFRKKERKFTSFTVFFLNKKARGKKNV